MNDPAPMGRSTRPPLSWIAPTLWAALIAALAAVLLQAWLVPRCSMLLRGPLYHTPECLGGFLDQR